MKKPLKDKNLSVEGKNGAVPDTVLARELAVFETQVKEHLKDELTHKLAIGDLLNSASEMALALGQGVLPLSFKAWSKRVSDKTYECTLNYRRSATRFPVGDERDKILKLMPTAVYELARYDDETLVERAIEAARQGLHVNRDTIRAWANDGCSEQNCEVADIGDEENDAITDDVIREAALEKLAAILLDLDESISSSLINCLEALDFDVKPLRDQIGGGRVRSSTSSKTKKKKAA